MSLPQWCFYSDVCSHEGVTVARFLAKKRFGWVRKSLWGDKGQEKGRLEEPGNSKIKKKILIPQACFELPWIQYNIFLNVLESNWQFAVWRINREEKTYFYFTWILFFLLINRTSKHFKIF